jgi:rhodanese-related sulfurtransferase
MRFKLARSILTSALFAIAATSVSLSYAGTPAAVDVKQVATMQSNGALLLDVREADEYAQGHAPGAILIPLGQLGQRLTEIARYKNQPVALICRSGNRSAKAQKLLEQAGFSATSNVEGGMIAWQKSGLPVVLGAAPR